MQMQVIEAYDTRRGLVTIWLIVQRTDLLQ